MNRKMWMYPLLAILMLAALACTCTSSLPDIGPSLVENDDADTADAADTAADTAAEANGNAAAADDTASDDGDAAAAGDVAMIEGYPVTDDASDVFNTSFGGIVGVTYKTDLTLDEAADFYRTQMENLGYTLDQDVFSAEGGILTYTADGSLLTISLGVDPATDKTQVTIASLP